MYCEANPVCDDNQTLDSSVSPPVCVPKCDENQTLDTTVTPPICKNNCDQSDTDYPALKDQEGVIYNWTSPDDLSSQCTSRLGNVQQKRVSCVDNYRCTCPYDPFPSKADNEKVLFTWSENSDRSNECLIHNGEIQKSRVACSDTYRCVGKNRKGSGYSSGGLFGGRCGAEDSWPARWIILDITPDACERHDACYSDCSKTQQECDLEFYKENSI